MSWALEKTQEDAGRFSFQGENFLINPNMIGARVLSGYRKLFAAWELPERSAYLIAEELSKDTQVVNRHSWFEHLESENELECEQFFLTFGYAFSNRIRDGLDTIEDTHPVWEANWPDMDDWGLPRGHRV